MTNIITPPPDPHAPTVERRLPVAGPPSWTKLRTLSRTWLLLYVCRVPLVLGVAIALLGWQVEQLHEIVRVYIIDTGTDGFRLQSWCNLAVCYGLLYFLTVALIAWSRYALVNRFPVSLAHNVIVRALFEHLPVVLALLPWIGAFLAVNGARAGVPEEHLWKAYLLLVAIPFLGGLSLFAARSFIEYRGIGSVGQRDVMQPYIHKSMLVISLAFGISFFAAAVLNPWWLGRWVGTIGILLAASLGVLPFLTLLTAHPRLPRWHWLSVLLALALLFSFFDLNDNHPVRPLARQDGMASGTSGNQKQSAVFVPTMPIHEAFELWLKARPSKPEEALPVVLVAAEGGGIRAAYFTALILATLQDRCPAFARHVFAISGVSGGSVGAAVFQALMADEVAKFNPEAKLPALSDCHFDGKRPASGSGKRSMVEAVEAVLREDLLAPLTASLLFPDALQRFLFWPIDRWDRAVTLEQTLERAYAAAKNTKTLERSLYRSWDPRLDAPLVLFNTTLVTTGERVIATPVALLDERFHRVKTLMDLAPSADVRVSTAAMLSARFTFVTPAAYIGNHSNKLRLVDGGYFENSGAATLDEVLTFVTFWAAQSNRKVVPIVIRISNTPVAKVTVAQADRQEAPAVALGELLSPVRAMLATREARGELAAEALKTRVTGMQDDHRCAEFIEFQIDADRAMLPLGWQLSQAARQGLRRQFDIRPACDVRQRVVNACSANDVVESLQRLPAVCAG